MALDPALAALSPDDLFDYAWNRGYLTGVSVGVAADYTQEILDARNRECEKILMKAYGKHVIAWSDDHMPALGSIQRFSFPDDRAPARDYTVVATQSEGRLVTLVRVP